MVQVIRFDAHRHEPAEQGFQHHGIVVDAAQQHSLRQNRYAGAHEAGHGVFCGGCQFARMVGVDHDPDRLIRRQCRDQSRGNAAWVDDRNPSVKADNPEMRYLVERADNRSQRRGAKINGSPPVTMTSQISGR